MNKLAGLDKLIEHVLGAGLVVEETNEPMEKSAASTTRTLKLPKFGLSEAWGRPEDEDRDQVAVFMERLSGNTLAEKITGINKFINDCDESCIHEKDITAILANLLVLDAFHSLITDFNPQTGGYIMEALLTAILGGKAKQQVVRDKDGNRHVEDIWTASGEPISIKFLAPGSAISGSKYLLRGWVHNNGPLKYYLIQKYADEESSGWHFYEFTIGSKGLGKPGTIDLMDLPIKQGDWMGEPFAKLDYGSKENLRDVANKYVTRIGERILDIFNGLDALITATNGYLLGGEMAKGKEAQVIASKLSDDIADNLKNK